MAHRHHYCGRHLVPRIGRRHPHAVCHLPVVLVGDCMGLGHHHHYHQNGHHHHHHVDHPPDDMIRHRCHHHCHLNIYLLMCFDVCLQK